MKRSLCLMWQSKNQFFFVPLDQISEKEFNALSEKHGAPKGKTIIF